MSPIHVTIMVASDAQDLAANGARGLVVTNVPALAANGNLVFMENVAGVAPLMVGIAAGKRGAKA